MIISISGTPGTGKTEAAGALADRLGWRLVELNALAEEKGLYSGYDEARRCRIVDVGAIGKEVAEMAKSSRNLILESHYAHDMPCDVAVILRASPVELRKRLVGKGWTRQKIEENIQSEIMEVCRSEALEQGRDVLEVDTTGKTAKMVAEDIAKKLRLAKS